MIQLVLQYTVIYSTVYNGMLFFKLKEAKGFYVYKYAKHYTITDECMYRFRVLAVPRKAGPGGMGSGPTDSGSWRRKMKIRIGTRKVGSGSKIEISAWCNSCHKDNFIIRKHNIYKGSKRIKSKASDAIP